MKKVKKLAQILMMILIIGVLAGCGKKQEKPEVPDSDDWHDAQVIAHDIRLKDVGNLTVSDVEKLGFKKSFYPNDVEPNEKAVVSFVAADGSQGVYDFRVINKTGKKASIDKCNINSIYILIPEADEDTIIRATDIYMPNGVKAGMTSEEIKKIMGDPDKEKINDEVESLYKTWIYNLNSEDASINMIFDKETDTINTLILRY